MQRPYEHQIEETNSSSCCRPTVPFFLTSLAIFLIYYYDYSNFLNLDFKGLERNEFWRIFTSPLASDSQSHLALNLMACGMLTMISERTKGSLLHCIDLIAKTFLVNSVSLLLYIVALSLSILYEGSFSYILQIQNETPSAGLQYILALELFLALKDTGIAEEAAFKERCSKKATLLMAISLFVIGVFYFRFIGLYSAILIGVMMRLGLFKYLPTFAKSEAVLSFEQKLKSAGRMFYLSPRTIAGNDFYEPAEQASIHSSKEMQSATNGSRNNPSIEEDEFDPNEDELSKSRYEEDANVQDYVLESKDGHSTKAEQESFEI